ncbi:MAG: hypothetical protein WC785_06285 [Tatlockia sp.]|jgi:hypothetical protein
MAWQYAPFEALSTEQKQEYSDSYEQLGNKADFFKQSMEQILTENKVNFESLTISDSTALWTALPKTTPDFTLTSVLDSRNNHSYAILIKNTLPARVIYAFSQMDNAYKAEGEINSLQDSAPFDEYNTSYIRIESTLEACAKILSTILDENAEQSSLADETLRGMLSMAYQDLINANQKEEQVESVKGKTNETPQEKITIEEENKSEKTPEEKPAQAPILESESETESETESESESEDDAESIQNALNKSAPVIPNQELIQKAQQERIDCEAQIKTLLTKYNDSSSCFAGRQNVKKQALEHIIQLATNGTYSEAAKSIEEQPKYKPAFKGYFSQSFFKLHSALKNARTEDSEEYKNRPTSAKN